MAGNHVPSRRASLNGLSFSELKQFVWTGLQAAHTFQARRSVVVWMVLLAVLVGSCRCAIPAVMPSGYDGAEPVRCCAFFPSSALCHEMKQGVSRSGRRTAAAIAAKAFNHFFLFFTNHSVVRCHYARVWRNGSAAFEQSCPTLLRCRAWKINDSETDSLLCCN